MSANPSPAAGSVGEEPGPVERLQQLLAGVESLPAEVRESVEELVGALLGMYGEGLARIVGAVQRSRVPALEQWLADDEVVASLLLLHDLYPVPLEQRVRRALEHARPYVESHGGSIELVALEQGVARIRLGGTCDGCPASASTLDLLVKQALDAEAPDLRDVVVEGQTGAGGDLVQIGAAPAPAPTKGGGRWVALDAASAGGPGTLAALEHDGREILVANLGGERLAYQDACASCRVSLAPGSLDGEVLVCPGCGERFDLRRAGRALGGGAPLRPIPLLAQPDGALGLVLEA